jgi:hypothetical protein
MPRRSGVSDFIQSFNDGYDTINRVGKDFATSKVAKAQETQVYTQDQAQELEALASAKDANGNPYYKIDATPDGKYNVTPNFKNETGDEPTDYAPTTMAAQGVNFLGKSYDKPLDENQKTGARQQAMAGVMEQFGDAEGAMRYRQSAKQGELTDMQIAQAKRQGVRDEKADAHTAALEQVDKDVSQWDLQRRTNPDGTMRDMTPDDQLMTNQYRVAKLVQAGKLTEANALAKDNMSMALTKIQAQSAERSEAIKKVAAAVAQGDFSLLDDFYNTYVPDGAHVTDVTQDPKSGKITIERESLDGRKLAPTVVGSTQEAIAGLQMFDNPNSLYNFSQSEFQRHLHEKADKRAEKQLGMEGARLKLSQDAATDSKNDKTALRAGNVAYETARQANDPEGMKAATLDIIKAGGTGVGAGNANDPSEVKLARAMVSAGMAPDMRTGLEMAITKKGQSGDDLHNGFVQAGLKNMGSAEDSVAKADDAMKAMGYTKKNGRWSQGSGAAETVAKFGSAADAEAAAKAGKLKAGDKVEINGRTATYKP